LANQQEDQAEDKRFEDNSNQGKKLIIMIEFLKYAYSKVK